MRIPGCVAIGVFLLGAAQATAQPPAPLPPSPTAKPELVPPPAQAHPKSACAASSAAQHVDHACPTCGHESACSTCKPKKLGCVAKLFKWMSYRGERVDKACNTCCEPHLPPLYAWFPCRGGDCDDCGDGTCGPGGPTRGGIICRLHGVKNCGACRGCPKGQCGAFWFVGRCKVNYPAQQNCGCSSTAPGVPEIATPAAVPEIGVPPVAVPAAPAPVDPLAALSSPPVQQTVSYKQDAGTTAKAPDAAPLKPVAPKRVSTYRPDLMPGAMPVISPEQFRKKPKQ